MIWINGEWSTSDSVVSAYDRGVLLGDGIFETMAVVDGTPVHFDDHLARLADGTRVLDLPIPYSNDELRNALAELCEREGVGDGSARITLLRGSGPRGVVPPDVPSPTTILTATSGKVGLSDPLRVIIAEQTRRNDRSPLSRIKSTNYGDAILAAQEARRKGADDALMLNTHDNICEATSANVFCVIDGETVTPPIEDGVLPGIIRGRLIAAGHAVERSISRTDVNRAAAIFLTNSMSIRPVTEVNGQPLDEIAAIDAFLPFLRRE